MIMVVGSVFCLNQVSCLLCYQMLVVSPMFFGLRASVRLLISYCSRFVAFICNVLYYGRFHMVGVGPPLTRC